MDYTIVIAGALALFLTFLAARHIVKIFILSSTRSAWSIGIAVVTFLILLVLNTALLGPVFLKAYHEWIGG